ncbi:hypothetical protein BDZ89DRAFT_1038399 [Hymenopellis radicata]|nr:hypothetical protein BDZ89DRAFT_1038399 [Hymenopellis radicata]
MSGTATTGSTQSSSVTSASTMSSGTTGTSATPAATYYTHLYTPMPIPGTPTAPKYNRVGVLSQYWGQLGSAFPSQIGWGGIAIMGRGGIGLFGMGRDGPNWDEMGRGDRRRVSDQ